MKLVFFYLSFKYFVTGFGGFEITTNRIYII